MSKIHNREPAYISKENEDRWLGEYNKRNLEEPEDVLEAWEVSKNVNKPTNNNEQIIEKLSTPTS